MKYIILQIVTVVLTLAVVLFVGYLFYTSVMNSNMPDWLKYMLLR